MSNVAIMANPRANAGRRQHRVHDVLACLHAHGATTRLLNVASPEAARAALALVRSTPNERLILIGGDGLVHLALGVLAGTDVEVGLIPTGTGNDFAHALGLDRGDVDTQVRRALREAHPLDAIKTTAGWVASVATLGFSAAVNARANTMSWPRGSSRYTAATLLELRHLEPVPVTLDLDGEIVEVRTALLAVANTAYFGGGMAICPDARPDDQLLDIAVIGDVGPKELLRVFPRVFRGTHVADPGCTIYRARRVHIAARTDIWGDGEFLGSAPMTCEVVPAALRWAGIEESVNQ